MAIFKIFIRDNEECALYGKSRDNRHALPKLPQFRHRVQIQLPCPDIENQSKFSIEPKGREKEIFQYHQLAGFRLNSPKRSIFPPRLTRRYAVCAKSAERARLSKRGGAKRRGKFPDHSAQTRVKSFKNVPGEGVEPSRCRHRRILSPLRLPIPPSGQKIWEYDFKKSRHSQGRFGNRKARASTSEGNSARACAHCGERARNFREFKPKACPASFAGPVF